MSAKPILAILALALSIGGVRAQLPGPGLGWYGGSGAFAGSYLPSCSNLGVTTARGELVALRVSGDQQAAFVLLAAFSATSCQPIPGLGNALVLDPPLVTLAIGVLTQTTPCLSCPPGFESITFTVPRTIPLGASLSLQAVSFGANQPAFTVAVTGTVR